jgi:hypothetical protein
VGALQPLVAAQVQGCKTGLRLDFPAHTSASQRNRVLADIFLWREGHRVIDALWGKHGPGMPGGSAHPGITRALRLAPFRVAPLLRHRGPCQQAGAMALVFLFVCVA